MKNIIKLLSIQDANQISAGYVIQRPASVVKELLVNSIYAHAKNIKLILLNGGKDLINVIDDGDGMNPEEAQNSLRIFYTSKLSSIQDFKSLKTKGFRGEALYYISLVSQIELYSKKKSSEFGVFLTLENQTLKYPPILLNDLVNGTSIYVKKLFNNCPNKKTFLKSSHIELKYIISEFNALVLSHPEIHFVLIHNKKRLNSLKPSDLKSRIIKLFGYSSKKVLIKVFQKEKLFLIKGYITSPSFWNTKVKNYYLFVNNRYVVNKRIHNAIIKAYNGIISPTNKPNYYLFLSISEQQIEQNICHSKKQIVMKSEAEICQTINIIIKEYLGIPNVFKFYSKQNITKDKPLDKLQEFIKILDLSQCPYKNYKKYILVLLDFGVLIINKSRAYKLYLAAKLKQALTKNHKLYPPINIKWNKFLKKRKLLESLAQLGFKIKGFDQSLSILSSPKCFKRNTIYRLFYDISQDYQLIENSIEKTIYKTIYNIYNLENKKNIDSLELSKLIKTLLTTKFLEPKLLFFLDLNKIDLLLKRRMNEVYL